MKKLALTAALGAACLALGACQERAENTADEGVTAEGSADNGTATATVTFPKGARIVEEDGVTYRIDPDGTRVTLTATDSRIVVEDGVRYRVDPDGTRVKIDPQGVAIDVDLPDVDVGINDKGNPDIDVKTEGDNNAGPD